MVGAGPLARLRRGASHSLLAGLVLGALVGLVARLRARPATLRLTLCAAAVARLVAGGKPDDPKLINTCYSLVAPDYGISIAGVYRPADGQIREVEGSAGVSPADAPSSTRALEATFANDWFKTITQEVFG